MLSVIHKETGKVREVYGMTGMRFMFWDEAEGAWVFDEIDNYRPLPDLAKAIKAFGQSCGVMMED